VELDSQVSFVVDCLVARSYMQGRGESVFRTGIDRLIRVQEEHGEQLTFNVVLELAQVEPVRRHQPRTGNLFQQKSDDRVGIKEFGFNLTHS